MAQKPSNSIFINPKFKNIHVNPNFLQTSNSKVHFNPKFLQANFLGAHLVAYQSPPLPLEPIVKPPLPPTPAINNNAIIRNTRRTLIRAPAVAVSCTRSNVISSSKEPIALKLPTQPQHQLIKISKNKLVTAAHLMKCQQKENELIKNTTKSIIKTKKLQRKADEPESIYKLDHRTQKKKKIISTYSIRRVSPKKSILSDRKQMKSNKMININGVLYKSTSNKLERTSSVSSNEKLLIIRGETFILDESGTKIQRESENGLKLSRIDIGGLTYRASQSGTYERDNSHQVRSHLSLAKTKSISLLARNVMKKSNLICPIYRRLGKCLAYANGRCHKVHDPRYVIVCPKFLKGSCENEKCLLSHNANLHKMPVCKYFLQGLCQKQRECLYLHKKMSDDTKLCAEFLKGYCPKADKCNLLHDFPPSEHRDKKKFSIVRKRSKRETSKAVEDAETVRYYIDDSEQSTDNVPKRGKLQSLPSYIPL